MRDSKFRGKCTSSGEFKDKWVYGDLIQNRGRCYIRPHVQKINVKGHLAQLVIMHEVDPETVGQFIDLPNYGVWEGDIYEFTRPWSNGALERGVVKCTEHAEWAVNAWMLTGIYEHGKPIGNIHDNPELLQPQGGEQS